jgi:hypothetical protein
MNDRCLFTRLLDRFGLAALIALFVLTGTALAGGRVTAVEPTQEILDEAHAMIVGSGTNKGNDKLVLGFSYPTAKSLTRIDYLNKSVAGDGSFTLTYKYLYRDNDNDPADFEMRFDFSAKGKLTGARPVQNKHSSFWPPMSTAEITLDLVKETIRNDEKLKKEPVWKALLTVDSAADFMVGVMNIKAGK